MLQPIFETDYYQLFIHDQNSLFLAIQPHTSASDGTNTNRPPSKSIGRLVQHDGTVNYYEAAKDEVVQDWCLKLGDVVMRGLVRKEVKGRIPGWDGRYDMVLMELPEGYQLFTHRTGDRHSPREDHYLYGSNVVHVFRSPMEFVPHLIWLLRGQPSKRDGSRDCDCQYCDGSAAQTDISRRYLNKTNREVRGPSQRAKTTTAPRKRQPRAPRQTVEIPFKDYTKLSTSHAT